MAYEAAREYLDTRKDKRSSVCSFVSRHASEIDHYGSFRNLPKEETWTGIDRQKTNINEQRSYTKGNMPIEKAHIQSSYTGDTENAKQDFHRQSGATDCRDSATQEPVQ